MSSDKYSFDKVIKRENSRAIKYDFREKLFGTSDVIPLWVADMDFPVAPAIQKALQKRVDHPVMGYTNRPQSFFNAIKSWLKAHYDWSVDDSWLEFSPGVVPNIAIAVQAFTDVGDGVVIQPPVYPPFFSVVRDFGREVIENPLKNENGRYYIDFEHLDKVTSNSSVKLLLLCHPHNPVGRVWSKAELYKIGEIALKNGVTIISDEIHCDLTLYKNKHTPIASLSKEIADITVTCMAPSKTFNLAGLSTAYMVVSNEKLLHKLRTYLSGFHLHMGNVFGPIALEAAYNESQEWLNDLKNYLEGNIDFVIDFINKKMPELKVEKPEATYLLWINFEGFNMKSSQLKSFLVNEAKIGLNDGLTFGKQGRGFMRMNIASSRTVIEKALNQLLDARNRIIK
ncbi:PatB family C-S lyase [Marinilabiliaceae bacterium ANBcel2]|nr:PatB family C-S lyase [Marinilabiliaceae bacterium ANBcel2]